MIGPDIAVLCVDEGAFNEGQKIPLHSFCGDPLAAVEDALGSDKFIDFVQEDYAFLLHALDGLLVDVYIRVHEFEFVVVHRVEDVINFFNRPCNGALGRIRWL